MFADVAKSSGAQEGIGDGVKDDVSVAVAGKAAAVRDLDPAKHDRAISRKSVDIEPQARARAETACKPLLGALEIIGKGEFFEDWIALDCGNLHSGSANYPSLIGGRGAGPALIGSPQPIEPKRLGRLNSDHAGSIDELLKALANARERIADGKDGRGSVVKFQARKQPIDD